MKVQFPMYDVKCVPAGMGWEVWTSKEGRCVCRAAGMVLHHSNIGRWSQPSSSAATSREAVKLLDIGDIWSCGVLVAATQQ